MKSCFIFPGAEPSVPPSNKMRILYLVRKTLMLWAPASWPPALCSSTCTLCFSDSGVSTFRELLAVSRIWFAVYTSFIHWSTHSFMRSNMASKSILWSVHLMFTPALLLLTVQTWETYLPSIYKMGITLLTLSYGSQEEWLRQQFVKSLEQCLAHHKYSVNVSWQWIQALTLHVQEGW